MKIRITLSLFAALFLFCAFKEKSKPAYKLKKDFTKQFAFIPAVSSESQNLEISPFYMMKYEVTNAQYQEFLNSLEDEELVKLYSIQSDNWTALSPNTEPFSQFYHTHPAYQNYPVVNITKEAAEAYCQWLTEQYAQMDIGLDDEYQVVFKLPSRAEWVHAANGKTQGPYAWGGPHLRNAKGCFLANFVGLEAENIHRNPESGEYEVIPTPDLGYMGTSGDYNANADVLAPSHSYIPNQYGLLNMNGNAAEILADTDQAAGGSWRCPGYDIRNESLMSYETASPEVGFRPIAMISKR